MELAKESASDVAISVSAKVPSPAMISSVSGLNDSYAKPAAVHRRWAWLWVQRPIRVHVGSRVGIRLREGSGMRGTGKEHSLRRERFDRGDARVYTARAEVKHATEARGLSELVGRADETQS